MHTDTDTEPGIAARTTFPRAASTGLHSVQPTARDETILAGERALDELPTVAKTDVWDRWMRIASALEAIQSEAMFAAQLNSPDGHDRRYRDTHADLIKRHRFDRITKGERCRLLECLRKRFEIEAWLETLPVAGRLKLVHPLVILRNWKSAMTTPDPNARKRSSTIGELRKRLAELEQQIARLREDDGGTLTGKDSARDAARLLRALFSESKLSEIRRLLGRSDVP